MSMTLMTGKDFDEDERWKLFAAEYIKNGGVMSNACRVAGLDQSAAARMKKDNPCFVPWLNELVSRKMSSAINKGDLRLAGKVAEGKAMEAGMCRTQKLLYERNNKLQAANVNVTVNNRVELPEDIMEDLKNWLADKRLRERQIALGN